VRLSSLILRTLPLLAAAGCLGGAIFNLTQLETTLPLPPIGPADAPVDSVTRSDARFAAVRAALEARKIHGAIGYYPDEPKDRLAAAPRGIERYFQAQFALAPLILQVDGQDSWIVTDFDRLESAHRLPAGWSVAADCGAGVSLWHRAP